jgi:intracellular protein transport protein USO1
VPEDSLQYAHVKAITDDVNNITLLLSLLEETDKNIRFFTTRLLTILMANRSGEVQSALLQSPTSITTLLDLIQSGTEMLRNGTTHRSGHNIEPHALVSETLLMLIELTRTNVEIQKIVAFGPRDGSAFEMLLSIIEQEGLGNGGIVVQDSLLLLNNLLRGNISNQNFFRETRCISRLPGLLSLEKSDMWILTDDKQSILKLALETVSIILSPQNPGSFNNQTLLRELGVVDSCLQLALGGMNSTIVRTRALWALGDLLRSNDACRSDFEAARFAPSDGQSSITSLSKLFIILTQSKIEPERKAAFHALTVRTSPSACAFDI